MIISDEVILFSAIMLIVGKLMLNGDVAVILVDIIIPFVFY